MIRYTSNHGPKPAGQRPVAESAAERRPAPTTQRRRYPPIRYSRADEFSWLEKSLGVLRLSGHEIEIRRERAGYAVAVHGRVVSTEPDLPAAKLRGWWEAAA